MKRKPISKNLRKEVYDKYDGHCAYCGCELEMKDMQVDHILSVCVNHFRKEKTSEEMNEIDNLMPSCRQCNYYKDTYTIDGFRERLKTLMSRVKLPFIYRLAEKYGMVKELEWDGEFYFEKIEKENGTSV